MNEFAALRVEGVPPLLELTNTEFAEQPNHALPQRHLLQAARDGISDFSTLGLVSRFRFARGNLEFGQ